MRPWSVTNCLSRLVFLKSSASTVKSIFGFGRGVRISVVPVRPPRPPRFSLSVLVLRGIKLFDFLVHRMAAQGGVIFLQLQFFGLQFFVATGDIAGRRLALLARFGAFDCYSFTGHKLFLFLRWFFFRFIFFLHL